MKVGTSERMPVSIKFCVAIVGLQALGLALAAFVLLEDMNSRLDHGQEVQNPGATRLVAYLFVSLSIALLGAGFFFFKRSALARNVVYAYALIAAVVQVLTLVVAWIFYGFQPAVAVGLVMLAAIFWILEGKDSDEWFGR